MHVGAHREVGFDVDTRAAEPSNGGVAEARGSGVVLRTLVSPRARVGPSNVGTAPDDQLT